MSDTREILPIGTEVSPKGLSAAGIQAVLLYDIATDSYRLFVNATYMGTIPNEMADRVRTAARG